MKMSKELRERCRPECRNLLAFLLKNEVGAKQQFKHLRNLGARNMRHDTMLYRLPDGHYERCPDVGAWYAECRGGLFVAMIRRDDGSWTLHS